MSESAFLEVDGQRHELPMVEGTEHERAVDIGKLRRDSGIVTLDPAYVNTASTRSSITFIDGEKGILRYRGYPIEQLAAQSTFVETTYLLIYGRLPTADELEKFRRKLAVHSMIHEDMKHFYDGFPSTSHPMAILSAMVCSLSSFYPGALDPTQDEDLDLTVCRLLSKVRTLAAYSYKKSVGQPFMHPKNSLGYCANFLHMMFAVPAEEYEVDEQMEKALNLLLILHADHEQNCSTSTVRLVGSAQTNMYASISAGICALWGKLHGGANQAVLLQLEQIHRSGEDVKSFIAQAKDKTSNFRLMGFGHRVYKNFDPRARIIKEACHNLLNHLGIQDPLLDIALQLEDAALSDEYFVERKLYPNVDFYSGLMYRAMGIPVNMFTVMFALGRLPGWIAHFIEMHDDPDTRIGRPRQIYTGETERDYVPFSERNKTVQSQA